MYICMYICMYVCVYVCVYVCMYVCVYVCMYACMYVCMYLCMYVCNVCMYVCMYAYMYRVPYTDAWNSSDCDVFGNFTEIGWIWYGSVWFSMWFNWFASLMWFDNISCGFLKIKILIPMTDFVLGGMLRWHKANVDRNTVIHTTWKKVFGWMSMRYVLQ